jgi:hypothetical protein
MLLFRKQLVPFVAVTLFQLLNISVERSNEYRYGVKWWKHRTRHMWVQIPSVPFARCVNSVSPNFSISEHTSLSPHGHGGAFLHPACFQHWMVLSHLWPEHSNTDGLSCGDLWPPAYLLGLTELPDKTHSWDSPLVIIHFLGSHCTMILIWVMLEIIYNLF